MEEFDPNEIDFYVVMAEQARKGDRESAVSMLEEFSTWKDAPQEPPLVTFVASCIEAWRLTGFDPKCAAECFHIKRDSARPESWKIRQKHFKALRAYFLMRGRGKGYEEAKKIAASVAHLGVSSINKLLENTDEAETKRWCVLMTIENRRVRGRCITPPRKTYQLSR